MVPLQDQKMAQLLAQILAQKKLYSSKKIISYQILLVTSTQNQCTQKLTGDARPPGHLQ